MGMSMYCITIEEPMLPRQRKTRTFSYVVCAESAEAAERKLRAISRSAFALGGKVITVMPHELIALGERRA